MQRTRSDSRLPPATPRGQSRPRTNEGRIRVVVRKRPLSDRERDVGRRDVVDMTTYAAI